MSGRGEIEKSLERHIKRHPDFYKQYLINIKNKTNPTNSDISIAKTITFALRELKIDSIINDE